MVNSNLVLRLAGPMQSWGGSSQFNRRATNGQPTKSGIVGLLAAAQGRRRDANIDDLAELALGVRVDQAGSLLRDFHTVSDYRGRSLLSSTVNAKGIQKPANKWTHVTERFYLQDAAFVAVIGGSPQLLNALKDALHQPAFPLALGRRACPPTQPLVLAPEQTPDDLWSGTLLDVLKQVPWQAPKTHREKLDRQGKLPAKVPLPVTIDAPDGNDMLTDVPRSFAPKQREFSTRVVKHDWVNAPTGAQSADVPEEHDPFALLGW